MDYSYDNVEDSIMKTTEKINLMIKLEKGLMKLELEELNLISKVVKKREYTPWIYSFKELENLLMSSGFSSVELHACWPDYRHPEHINKYGLRNPHFSPISARKRTGKIGFKNLIANRIEWVLFKVFNVQFFAPSIIAIAHK